MSTGEPRTPDAAPAPEAATTTDEPGRHARPADDDRTDHGPGAAAGATATAVEEAPAARKRSRFALGGHPLGRYRASGPLLLASGLLIGLFLAPVVLDRLDYDIPRRAARAARSAATSWPGGGEPWFWPSWVALLAGAVAVVLVALALAGLRLPRLVVGGLGLVLAVTTARAAWATLDVVNGRLWDLLPVVLVCLLAFGLAVAGTAQSRAPVDDDDAGSGAGGAASAALGGAALALVLLVGGATVAHVQAEGLGPAGPPQDVAGLLSIRAADAAAVDDLAGPWVPQLDAAQLADDAAATGYSTRHRDRGALLPVLLLRGDDVTADDLDDGWWLTVAAQGFADEAAVQQWCAGAGLAPPACVPRELTG